MTMMRCIAVCAFFFLASLHLAAQKIGYVSTDAIREKFELNILAQQRLAAFVEEWKNELSQRQKHIDDLELEIKKNRLIWSDQERTVKEKELEDKKRERETYARDKFAPGGEHDKAAENLFKGIWTKMYIAIQKVSAAEGYDIVWDKSAQPLVYVNAKYDITVKVMKELGIDATELDRQQQNVIDSDPRNKKPDDTRKRKSRRATSSEQDTTTTVNPTPTTTTPTPTPPSQQDTTKTPVVPSALPTDTTKPKEQDIPR
ncbi:MAG: OmpH family outer membrane protein [Bacteroidetes bacterium]|nr:OmpH family outer membrane protein [Bacteroidota bacterium]